MQLPLKAQKAICYFIYISSSFFEPYKHTLICKIGEGALLNPHIVACTHLGDMGCTAANIKSQLQNSAELATN